MKNNYIMVDGYKFDEKNVKSLISYLSEIIKERNDLLKLINKKTADEHFLNHNGVE